MTCTCACHEAEENHDQNDCYCMNDKLRESFERFIDENEALQNNNNENGQ